MEPEPQYPGSSRDAPAASPAPGSAEPLSGSAPEWMRGAYTRAIEKLRSLQSRWTEQRRGPAETPTASAPAEAQQVAEVASHLAAALRQKREDSVSVRNLEQMAARLHTLGAPGGDPAGAFRKQVPDPPSPEEWLRAGRAEEEYFEQLSDSLRRAKDLAASGPRGPGGPERGAGWRGSAEQLLHIIASRRPAEGEPDPDGLHRMHERLLQLLGWKEIAVNLGDSVNRDLHEIESMRGTTELPPNRVLEVISPGYRDVASGEIVRKTKIVLSQQKLG